MASAGSQRSARPSPSPSTPYFAQVDARNCIGPPAPAELTAPSCVHEGLVSCPWLHSTLPIPARIAHTGSWGGAAPPVEAQVFEWNFRPCLRRHSVAIDGFLCDGVRFAG